MPNTQGGTIANFEERVPLQDAYLALVMYDNLAIRLQKSQNCPLRDSYLGPPAY